MRLIRLVSTYITPSSQEEINIKIGTVSVKTLKVWNLENKKRCLLYGSTMLSEDLKITSEKLIITPKDKREEIEKAIETAVNLFAVATGSSRTFSSPIPYIALCYDNDEERKMLEQLDGFVLEPILIPGAPFNIEFNNKLISVLQDRMDGISLLAEALSHTHSTGRFHEFLRVFERAFHRSTSRLVTPLTEFLSSANQGFSGKEIENWVVNLRHPTTHADTRENFILEAGIRPIIQRMEQAAYDVLFNKEEWRNPSSIRRKIWIPVSGTLSGKMDVFITKGKDQYLTFQQLDGFSSYPIDLTVSVEHFLPKNWWYKNVHIIKESGKIKICPPS